jgi:putative peptide zinc metalloprotease protein
MATLADSLVSSSARRLGIRKRPDLEAKRQRYLGRTYWVVKDPVGLNYFRFQEEEFAILQMLDGEMSLDEIKEKFEKDFPPQKITLEELQSFLGMLHKSGLVVAGVPGQGRQLNKRRMERVRKEWLAALSNILCIRFKGFDPERLLKWLNPRIGWFFHPAAITFVMAFAFSALALVLVEFDTFRSKLPEFHQFFSLHNAFLLAVTLGVTKVLHEFGHGLSCTRFGGECHEMGVMILVLTPCLYCNVSDSWMLPSKWQRAFIGAAGMYVELFLASIATYLWWFTHPGLLNNLCLNVMFISSVSTVMFNANPLLRYDGYYILADLAEIPNLRQKATTILGRKMGEWFLGLESPDDPFLPQQNQIFFALYSVAAVIYRWMVLLSILYFLYKVFEPYGLKVIGQAMALASLYGIFVQPVWNLYKYLRVPGRLDKVKKPRMYASAAGIVAIIAAFFFLPLPCTIICPLQIQARDAANIYIDVPGKLTALKVKSGAEVSKGQVLAQLQNIDLELEIAKLEAQVGQYETRLANLQRQRYEKPQAALEIPATLETLQTLKSQLKDKKGDLARLALKAPVDGVVLPPPEHSQPEDPEGQLPPWTGTPLEEKNVGTTLRESTLFCQVGDPKQMEAVLLVDQNDIGFVKGDQIVELQLEALPHNVLREKLVGDIAPDAVKIISKAMAAKHGGEVPTKTDQTGVERPDTPCYQVRVAVDDDEGVLRLGLRGRAKIHVDPQTLANRAWRFIGQTLNFKL